MNISKSQFEPASPISGSDTCVCTLCGDFALAEHEGEEPMCAECRAPLRYLCFPDEYCDLGDGD